MNVAANRPAGAPPQAVLSNTSVAARTLKWGGGFALAVLGGLLLTLGWLVAVTKPYEAGSTLGYNMGLAGGIGMLTLLAYPLRKRFPLLQRLGDMQKWFHYHVVIGIAAPVLILFHSTFHLGSMNGTVAFYSMLTVVASGIVGRFVYRHVHHSLNDTLLTLADAENALKASAENVRKSLAQYPNVGQPLEQFRTDAFAPAGSAVRGIWRFMTLRLQGRRQAIFVCRQIKRVLRDAYAQKEMSRHEVRLAYGLARQQIYDYVFAVCNASQFKSWQYLFSLWHLVHIPFIYLLVFSAVVHVVAVHVY
jgi:hypothetical protein